MTTSIVLFELNEVPWRVLDDYVAQHPSSTLARILPRCTQHTTVTEDRHLSPWVTWPSLHRGVHDTEHGVHHFGQDLQAADERCPPLWRVLRRRGTRVGVFGSLHSYPLPADAASYAFYVPDPFAPAPACFPLRLRSFQQLNLTMSRQSPRNVSAAIPWGAALRFAAHAPFLGLRPRTAWAALSQLGDERRRPWTRCRRRTFQTVLAFDLFEQLLRRTRPDFCTFFTNHVASAMHRYWAAAYPDDYTDMGFDAEWRATYKNEIDYAMAWFDRILGRLARWADSEPKRQLWVASSMGQAATSAQPLETQLYITALPRFMAALGLAPDEWSERPAMAPEVSLFVREDRAPVVRAALAELRIDGAPLHSSERERGFFMISTGHANLPPSVRDAVLGERRIPLEELGLTNVAIEDNSTSSAYHVPEGSLFIYEGVSAAPGSARSRPQLQTVDIAPEILRRLGAA